MFHTTLAVLWAESGEIDVLGVAKPIAWMRPQREDRKSKEVQTEKESQVWLNSLKAIGRPPESSRWIDRRKALFREG
jgi:hypothetical protein